MASRLSDLQLGHLRRTLQDVIEFVPDPPPLNNSAALKRWCEDRDGAATVDEVGKKWGVRLLALATATIAAGLGQLARRDRPATPRDLIVVDLNSISDYARAVFCLALDEAEGRDIDAWQIEDVLQNVLQTDEGVISKFNTALRLHFQGVLQQVEQSIASTVVDSVGEEARRTSVARLVECLRSHHFDGARLIFEPPLDTAAIASAICALANSWTPNGLNDAIKRLPPPRDGEESAARELLKMLDGATADFVSMWVDPKIKAAIISDEASWHRICEHVAADANCLGGVSETGGTVASVAPVVVAPSRQMPDAALRAVAVDSHPSQANSVCVNEIDFAPMVVETAALVVLLEEYQRRAVAHEFRASVALQLPWMRAGAQVIVLEQLLSRCGLGLEGDQLLPVLHGDARKGQTAIALVDWLRSVRGGTQGWGEKADGFWGLVVGMETMPDVSRLIDQLKLFVEDFNTICGDVGQQADPTSCAAGSTQPDSCNSSQLTDVASDRGNPRWNLWAIGLEHENKWQVFRKHAGVMRHRGVVGHVANGLQSRLLQAFAHGGGLLQRTDAVKLLNPHHTAGEIDSLIRKIRPELSRLRKIIRVACSAENNQSDPLEWIDECQGWQARINIGYAVTLDSDRLGHENVLMFKTHDELTRDELADLE